MDTNLNVHEASVRVGDYFVSATVSRVVEAIHDYEPNIEVQWIPPAARYDAVTNTTLPAFKLVYHNPDGTDFTLFHVPTDEDFDIRVLQRIIMNDNRRGTVRLSDYEAWEASQQLIERQKQLDELEAASDIVAHVIKSRLNTYKIDDNLVIKDGIPFNALKVKD